MTEVAAPPPPPPPPLPPPPPRPFTEHLLQPLPPPESPTLLVKHLPDALPLDTLKRLFSHYGASDIRPCVAAKMKNCAFVDFKDEAQAARAQAQLHRLRFLGKILAVERAKPYTPKTLSNDQNVAAPPSSALPQTHPPEAQRLSSSTGFSEGGIAGAGLRHEPIALSLGIDYPFPPHLEYAYPPPDGNILTNIVNALIAVPRFYTQVLHLMNKMNLPAPFRPALPTPPLPPPPPEPAAPTCPDRDLSSDESELESSEETAPGADTGEDVDDFERATKKRKGLVEEVVEAKSTILVPSERPLIKKKRPVLLQINLSSKGQSKVLAATKSHEVAEGPIHDSGLEEADDIKESKEPRSSATREELIAGRMPSNELFALPMFKNYTRGIPTSVLYIKNLAKDVTQDDLLYIFGAVFTNSEDFRSQLGVKLMQEGRMRGQAFVTFPSTGLAEDALNIVHGYMLKGKPMVVQFGRNPAATKTIGQV